MLSVDIVVAATGAVGMAVAVTGFAWLQLVRVWRARSVAGLSPTSVTLTLSASVLWALYALRVDDTVNLAVSVGAGVATLGVVSALLLDRRTSALTVRALAVVVGVAAVLLAAASFPWALAASAAAVVGVMLWPQAVTALRAADLSGVSAVAFGVRAVAGAVGWSAHTVATGDVWFLVQLAAA